MKKFPRPENSPATGPESQKEVLSDQSRNLIWILQSKLIFFAILEWVIRAISRDQKFSPPGKSTKLIYFKEENGWKSNIPQVPQFLFVSFSWFSVGFLWVPPPRVSVVFLRFPLFFFGFRGQVEILSFLKNHGKGWFPGCAKIFLGEKLIKSERKFRTEKKRKILYKKKDSTMFGTDAIRFGEIDSN